jgi:hypothetical protein
VNELGAQRGPALSDQLGVENDARSALYLSLGSLMCIPLGIGGLVFGVRAVGRARAVGMGTPGSAIAAIAISVCTTLCFGMSMLAVALKPFTTDGTAVVEPVTDPEPAAEEPSPSEGDPVVQPSLSDAPRGHLSLQVKKVYEHHKPSLKAPFHEPGGDWTFMDLEAGEGVEATFGIHFKPSQQTFSFGKAQLSVPSKAAGEAFRSAFGSKFGGTAGKVKPHKGPLPLNVAVLGQNQTRRRDGSFHGNRIGTWFATKLFVELDGHYGEVFFNYSLQDGEAELSEKDSEYADDLAYAFAAAF